MKQAFKGITPQELNKCKVFKSPKKGKKTFTITQKILDTIYNKGAKISKVPELIINLPINEKESYQLICQIKKLTSVQGEN